jgi:hypothetical protein
MIDPVGFGANGEPYHVCWLCACNLAGGHWEGCEMAPFGWPPSERCAPALSAGDPLGLHAFQRRRFTRPCIQEIKLTESHGFKVGDVALCYGRKVRILEIRSGPGGDCADVEYVDPMWLESHHAIVAAESLRKP